MWRRMRQAEHLAHMGETRMCKILGRRSEGKRLHSRSKYRCDDIIKIRLNDVGNNGVDMD
jgi:hypothetical protein